MQLNDVQAHLFAFFLADAAQSFTMAERFFPYGEVVSILSDKVTVAARPFDRKVRGEADAVATAFLNEMIARGGFSSVDQRFGSTMHQYQAGAYSTGVQALKAENPIIAKAEAAGPAFWDEAFAALVD